MAQLWTVLDASIEKSAPRFYLPACTSSPVVPRDHLGLILTSAWLLAATVGQPFVASIALSEHTAQVAQVYIVTVLASGGVWSPRHSSAITACLVYCAHQTPTGTLHVLCPATNIPEHTHRDVDILTHRRFALESRFPPSWRPPQGCRPPASSPTTLAP